jgi:hypothetical protein
VKVHRLLERLYFQLLSLDNPLYSAHGGSQHHQLTSSGTSSVSSSVPTLDTNNALSDSPTLRRRAYGHRHSRHVAAGKCTSYCLSCLLRQRVIASLLIVGLTIGITIVIASLVVYRRSKYQVYGVSNWFSYHGLMRLDSVPRPLTSINIYRSQWPRHTSIA